MSYTKTSSFIKNLESPCILTHALESSKTSWHKTRKYSTLEMCSYFQVRYILQMHDIFFISIMKIFRLKQDSVKNRFSFWHLSVSLCYIPSFIMGCYAICHRLCILYLSWNFVIVVLKNPVYSKLKAFLEWNSKQNRKCIHEQV